MYCPQCGRKNDDGSAYCYACGSPLPKPETEPAIKPEQEPAGRPKPETTAGPTPETTAGSMPETAAGTEQEPADGKQPAPSTQLKWWKFLVYFALFLSAILNLTSGILIMCGMQYGEGASLLYAVYRNMKALDIIYGLSMMALAGFAILTRQHLYRFKKDGPKMLLVLYGASLILTILYPLLASVIIRRSPAYAFTGKFLLQLCLSIVMIVVNKIYFDRRASLFVN